MATLTGRQCCLFFFDIVWQLITQVIDLGFQLRFVKQVNLVCGFFTAGAELLNPLPAQQFFEDLNVLIALFDRLVSVLNFSIFSGQFLLKTFNHRP